MKLKHITPSRRKNKKRLIAMVSWTIPLVYIMEKNADDNDLIDHPTNPNRGKNVDSNDLTYPSDIASIFYLLIVLKKNTDKYFRNRKKKTCLKILFGNV